MKESALIKNFNQVSKDLAFDFKITFDFWWPSGLEKEMTEVFGMMCRLFCQLLIPRATRAQVKWVITSIISLNFPGRKSNVHVVRFKYAMGTKFCSYAKTNK